MEDLPLSDWEQVLNVNLTGYFITSQRFGREMIKAGQGRLVHISTVASHSPETFSGVYSSTKAGVNMMSKMLAAEWVPTACAPTASSLLRQDPHVGELLRRPRGREEPQPPHRHAPHRRGQRYRRCSHVPGVQALGLYHRRRIKVDGGFSNMMGDLTAKPGGRRAFADNYLKNKGVELWSDESGVAKPTDQ